MRTKIYAASAVGFVLCNGLSAAVAQSNNDASWADVLGVEIEQEWSDPKHRAFDFWIGEWEMNWRAPVEGEFEHQKEGRWTHQRVFPVLGGKALLELAWDRDNPGEASQRGYSIRYLDTDKDRWVMAQNWPNAQNQGSAFLDQLMGQEHHGRLTMYSATMRPLPDGTFSEEHRRYNFADIKPGKSFRWDGSNTTDQGKNWFTWYVVDAHRISDLDPFRDAGSSLPGVHNETICTDPVYGAYHGLEGVWEGRVTDENGGETPARFTAGKVLDGCAVLGIIDVADRKTLLSVGMHPRLKNWVIYMLDDQPGTTHSYYVSKDAGAEAVFEQADTAKIEDEYAQFIVKSEFDVANAQRRIVWTTFNDSQLAYRVESRKSSQDSWETKATYNFER